MVRRRIKIVKSALRRFRTAFQHARSKWTKVIVAGMGLNEAACICRYKQPTRRKAEILWGFFIEACFYLHLLAFTYVTYFSKLTFVLSDESLYLRLWEARIVTNYSILVRACCEPNPKMPKFFHKADLDGMLAKCYGDPVKLLTVRRWYTGHEFTHRKAQNLSNHYNWTFMLSSKY